MPTAPTTLEEIEARLHNLLREARKKKEWELAVKINEIIGLLEAAKKEHTLLKKKAAIPAATALPLPEELYS